MTIQTKFDNFISLTRVPGYINYISYLEFFRALFFRPPPVSDFLVFAPTTLSLATLVLRTRLLLLLLERPLDDVTATGSSITGIAAATLTCVFVGNLGFAMAGTTAGTAIAVETAAAETTALAVALVDALETLLFVVLDMEEVEEVEEDEDEDDKLAGDSFGIIRFCEGSERTDEREKIRSSGVLLYLLAFEATKSEALRSM